MSDPSLAVIPVEFTKDMTEALAEHFDHFAVDGVLTLQMVSTGLFFYHEPSGIRQFLGAARPPSVKPRIYPNLGGLV